MKINLSSLPTIGNMTRGGGLATLFDGNSQTGAWAESTLGWAGVDFGSSPQAISEAVLFSASNGFDASGSASSIRLRLYGKNGGAPTGPTDGTLLGTLGYFTDPNAATSRSITTANTEAWRYVWATVETGVWAILLDIELYDRDSVALPPPPSFTLLTAERTVVGKSVNSPTLLTTPFAEIEGFRTRVQIEQPAGAIIDVRTDVVHRGEFTGYTGVLSIGMLVGYRYATTAEGVAAAPVQRVPNAVVGCNLMNRDPHHYEKLHACSDLDMQPGFYEFTVYMNAATDVSAYAQTNGLAALLIEGGSGLNRLRIVVDKGLAVIQP
jgi:hypothetical protein